MSNIVFKNVFNANYLLMYPVLLCDIPPIIKFLGQCINLVENPRQPLVNSAPISGICKFITGFKSYFQLLDYVKYVLTFNLYTLCFIIPST